MKYLSPYRLATYLLVLFCLGHTIGGMLLQQSLGLAADAVFLSMKTIHFTFNGSETSWYNFWFCFGLIASVFLLFSAVTAWTLAGVGPGEWKKVRPIAWALFVAHVANAALTWIYCFAAAGVLAAIIALLLGIGLMRASTRDSN